jgi:hypothetical protein
MANKTSCIKCGRSIDEFARACPFCGWWQSEPVPAQAAPPPAVDYTPPPDNRARNKLIGIAAFGVLMLLAFTIGAFIHAGSNEAKAAQSKNVAAPAGAQSSPRATVTLVPMTDGAEPPVIESPITSVTPGGTTTGGPSDATALPSDQYTAAAERMRAAQQQATGSVVDPRSITGPAYTPPPAQAPAPRPARPRQVASVQSQPVPVYQPIPHVRIDREETAQLALTVGTDGRVHDIDVLRAAPSVMGPLVGAVQQWRFRPATQNGQAVTSRFSVAVTFKP